MTEANYKYWFFMFMGPCIFVYNDHINTNETQLFMLFIWW